MLTNAFENQSNQLKRNFVEPFFPDEMAPKRVENLFVSGVCNWIFGELNWIYAVKKINVGICNGFIKFDWKFIIIVR